MLKIIKISKNMPFLLVPHINHLVTLWAGLSKKWFIKVHNNDDQIEDAAEVWIFIVWKKPEGRWLEP